MLTLLCRDEHHMVDECWATSQHKFSRGTSLKQLRFTSAHVAPFAKLESEAKPAASTPICVLTNSLARTLSAIGNTSQANRAAVVRELYQLGADLEARNDAGQVPAQLTKDRLVSRTSSCETDRAPLVWGNGHLDKILPPPQRPNSFLIATDR